MLLGLSRRTFRAARRPVGLSWAHWRLFCWTSLATLTCMGPAFCSPGHRSPSPKTLCSPLHTHCQGLLCSPLTFSRIGQDTKRLQPVSHSHEVNKAGIPRKPSYAPSAYQAPGSVSNLPTLLALHFCSFIGHESGTSRSALPPSTGTHIKRSQWFPGSHLAPAGLHGKEIYILATIVSRKFPHTFVVLSSLNFGLSSSR